MKAKLGKMEAVESMNYDSFKTLLKKHLKAQAEDSDTDGIIDYVLIDGAKLSWKGSDAPQASQPLLFIGQSNGWKKEIKSNKSIDLKSYSYGKCKLRKVGTNIEIALCPEKGKLTQASLLKPIKKAFKSFKPKTFFEVVSDLSTVGNDLESTDEQTEGEAIQKIGTALQKYHVAVTKIIEEIKNTASEEMKAPLMVKRNKLLKHLKHLCQSWEEEILPDQENLLQDDKSQTWHKIYQKWNASFEKQKAAKEGTSNDQEAIQAEEERMYTKALEDLDLFYENMEKGELIDPSVIESNIESLGEHLTKWKSFINGKTSSYPNELDGLEKILQDLQHDWKKIRPLLTTFQEKSALLDQALDEFNSKDANALLEELESISKQISQIG